MLRVLSLGAGVQSSTLALMIKHGEVPMVDCAIFADTGGEPLAVYEWLAFLKSVLPFPVYEVSRGNLETDIYADATKQTRYMLPTFTSEGGVGKRQCTKHYKIDVILRKVRELCDTTGEKKVTELIGISYDEWHRAKNADVKYIRHEFPLLEKRMTRGHCMEWLTRNGYKIPSKSSCIFCPYRGDKGLRELSNSEFDRVRLLDNFIRDKAGTAGTVQYLHPSRKPISVANLEVSSQVELFNNECEGHCGV